MSSLSVWLAIAGVDRDNSMCLYPETVGVKLPLNGAQFLGSGYPLPRPTRPKIEDGDLFVFSTDILHSSQLNVSDKTRVALTTRIDSGTPVFSKESLWFVQRWYSADGILAGRWLRKVVRAAENSIPRLAEIQDAAEDRSITIPGFFRVDRQYTVGPSDLIPENGTLTVHFDNKRILILRSNGQLRGCSARCPHGDYHLGDGYHDERVLICPGHGLEFDSRTGRSVLDRYRLAMFKVSEQSGTIFLGDPPQVSDR
jgi:nitrite reductase (NADH) small subunit